MTHMQPVPETFARTIAEVHGAAGVDWLARLPMLLEECARHWSLTIQPPFAPLTYNYVAPARRADGVEVVVKAGVPHRELLSEMAALRFYDGRGMVQLLDADADRGIMLLERLRPGTPLTYLEDDEQATVIAARVMRELWRPAPPTHAFSTVADWAAGMGRMRAHFDGGTGPLPTPLVERAERLFAELLATMDAPVVLHGDLHHDNILAATREPWLAIDPKGIVGEPAYEVGALLHNPLPRILDVPDPKRLFARRVDLLTEELGFERERILGWGVAQAVLSAWWTVEDHGYGWEPAIACAEILAALM